jgi:nucleoside-diphosphate-sugar epimerase
MQSVLVLGGAGFVGKAVCRELVRVGCSSVTSLNRSGVSGIEGVQSVKADALNPDSYARLQQIDTLIHCIGILSEPRNNTKVTFKSASFDTLNVALDNLPNLKRVAYISAADFGRASRLFLSPRYMEAKLAAEQLLATKADQLSVIIARPGFMYGADRSWTGPFSALYRFGTLFTAGIFPPPLDVNTVARQVVESLATFEKGLKNLHVSDMRNK